MLLVWTEGHLACGAILPPMCICILWGRCLHWETCVADVLHTKAVFLLCRLSADFLF